MSPVWVVLFMIAGGFLFNAWWLSFLGVLMIFLLALASFVKSRQIPRPVGRGVAPAGGRQKHKLLQAPQDMWEDDDIYTYLAAMQGSPFSSLHPGGVGDPLGPLSRSYAAGHPVPRSAIRNALPFSNYGRNSAFEQVFLGLPINIGAVINRRVRP